jgi:serine/threonine protein kinase
LPPSVSRTERKAAGNEALIEGYREKRADSGAEGEKMDGRLALHADRTLRLYTQTGYTEYTIRREIGRGGSCIVYDASRIDNLGNEKLVRIKECYPYALKIIRREDGSLSVEERDRTFFEAAKERFTEAYQKNHALFVTEELMNSVVNSTNLYEAYGTVYIVSSWMNGQTFKDARIERLHDCAAILLSSAKVLKNIHDAGFLYLDLKPENILTIRGSLDLVQLFDFDTMISIAELEKAAKGSDVLWKRSYSRG